MFFDRHYNGRTWYSISSFGYALIKGQKYYILKDLDQIGTFIKIFTFVQFCFKYKIKCIIIIWRCRVQT